MPVSDCVMFQVTCLPNLSVPTHAHKCMHTHTGAAHVFTLRYTLPGA